MESITLTYGWSTDLITTEVNMTIAALLFDEFVIFQTNASDTRPSVTSYVVASNPEVLSVLMRDANYRQISNQNAFNSENENIPNPASYTVPASTLNTFTVDFASSNSQLCTTQLCTFLKTPENTTNGLSNVHNWLQNSTNGNAPVHCPSMVKINRITPEPSKGSFTSSSSPCSQSSNSKYLTYKINKESQFQAANIDVPFQNHNAYQKPCTNTKRAQSGTKEATQQPGNINPPLVSTFNSSMLSKSSTDKVNLREFAQLIHLFTPQNFIFGFCTSVNWMILCGAKH